MNKANTQKNEASNLSQLLTNGIVASICDQFYYSDTIFYLTNLPGNYVVKPVNAQAGTYGAFPAGLKINSGNGSIDIKGSETGLEYAVWFVAKGSKDTCKKYITVSGINYLDSTYTMVKKTATAVPVYNANPLNPTDCSGGCQFDIAPAAQQVSTQGIAINKATGLIDLKKSIQNGALGKNPANGTFKDFTLQYSLGDKSGGAVNHLGFRLYYYQNKSLIPAALIETENEKKGQVLIEGEEESGGSGHGGHGSESLLTLSADATAKNGGQATVKCRPPYIIITQQ